MRGAYKGCLCADKVVGYGALSNSHKESEQVMFCPHCGNRIGTQTNFCPACGQALIPVVPQVQRDGVDPALVWVFWVLLGTLGVHRFYLGHIGWGVAYLLTGAFCGIGWFIDLFCISGWIRERNSPGYTA